MHKKINKFVNNLVPKAIAVFTVTMFALITKFGCWCYAKHP
jgi:hypothetical protein